MMAFKSPPHICANKLFAFQCYSTQEEEKNRPLDSTEGNCGKSKAYEQMKTKQSQVAECVTNKDEIRCHEVFQVAIYERAISVQVIVGWL